MGGIVVDGGSFDIQVELAQAALEDFFGDIDQTAKAIKQAE
jgi:hypothetical protein